MPLVERRYAEALIRVGIGHNSVEQLQQELKEINDLIGTSNELKKFLDNPTIDSVNKKAVIEKLLNKKANTNIINFLKLLIDKDRIKFLPQIIRHYTILADEIKKCLNITVVTAVETSHEQLNEIGEKFKMKYGSYEVKINHMIDSSIIGGVIVKIGDKMMDGSIRGKLDNMLSLLNHA